MLTDLLKYCVQICVPHCHGTGGGGGGGGQQQNPTIRVNMCNAGSLLCARLGCHVTNEGFIASG